MYVGEGHTLTENEEEAFIFDNVGDAMRCAAEASNSGNVFRIYMLYGPEP